MTSSEQPTLEQTDVLSRYATHSNHFNTFGITPRAFLPDKHLRLSVFCTTDQVLEEIIDIAKANVQGKVYGHGSCTVSFIEGLGLNIDYNNEPERHADIINWPLTKDEQKNFAQKLSVKVNQTEAFRLYPEPIQVEGDTSST